MIEKIKIWVNKNKIEAIVLAMILLVGAALRLYRINDYMTFLGDEGRDAIIVRNLLVHLDPILIGPGTSIGNMYLGPLYYYLMAPALLLAWFSPVGPAVMVALFGVATIFLIWFVARDFFPNSKYFAMGVSALYAASSTAIIFSRSSWNPNIMPFFALLCIYAIWKIHSKKQIIWNIVFFVSLAFVLNSHYLGVLLLPIYVVYWYITLRSEKSKVTKNKILKNSLIGLVAFSFLMSPLLIFDLRHNFQNYRALQFFLTNRESTFKGLGEALGNVYFVYLNLFVRLPGGRIGGAGLLTGIFAGLAYIFVLGKRVRGQADESPYFLIFVWLLVGCVGLAFIQREIYDHYMGLLFPVPYLLLAGLASYVYNLYKNTKIKIFLASLFSFSFALLLLSNLYTTPLKSPPARQLFRSKSVAEMIIAESAGERFNLAVIAERNYEDGYRYFLDVNNANVTHADPWHPETITEQLFVVCENQPGECDPTRSSKAEVANFGPSRVVSEWEIHGVVLYKLAHTEI